MALRPLLLIGTYTSDTSDGTTACGEGILGYAFDLETGALERRFAQYTEQPTYLVVDAERQLVYANQEIEEEGRQPEIRCFRIHHGAETSSITSLNAQPLRGCVPCHLELQPGRALWTAGYASSNLNRMPLRPDGWLEAQSLNFGFEGSGPRKEQDKAHIHCCVHDARRGRLYVADLGSDRIRVLEGEGDNWTENERLSLTVSAGSGPRHLLAHPTDPDRLLLMSELWPEVSILDVSDRPKELFRTLPFAPESQESQGGAAIRTCGAGRHVYVSERKSASVAVLRYDAAAPGLELIQRVSTHGEKPRDINLSPDGRWLIAANLDSHSLALFRRDVDTGELTFERLEEGVKSPSCVTWL